MARLLSGVALITGAASGIGHATVVAFVESGVEKLSLIDRNEKALEETSAFLKATYPAIDVLSFSLDISDEDALVSAINKTSTYFGRLDYAVNNAGVAGPMGPTQGVTLSEFRVPFDVNVFGTWIGMREQIKIMLKQDPLESFKGRRNKGVIINVASILGLVGTSETMPAIAYSSSKHAILGLTKSEASIYIKENIRINAVCPGLISTPIISHNGAEVAPAKKELEKSPIGRFGKPAEIADVIVFLASEMSSYVSGSGLVADGGHITQL